MFQCKHLDRTGLKTPATARGTVRLCQDRSNGNPDIQQGLKDVRGKFRRTRKYDAAFFFQYPLPVSMTDRTHLLQVMPSGLFEFLLDSLTFDLSQIINKQLAIQVIDLVLQTDRQQTFGINLVCLS